MAKLGEPGKKDDDPDEFVQDLEVSRNSLHGTGRDALLAHDTPRSSKT